MKVLFLTIVYDLPTLTNTRTLATTDGQKKTGFLKKTLISQLSTAQPTVHIFVYSRPISYYYSGTYKTFGGLLYNI